MRTHLFLLISLVLSSCSSFFGHDCIEISQLYFESEASSVVLAIKVDGEYTIQDVPTWVTVTPDAGTDEDNIIISVSANQSVNKRTGELKIVSKSKQSIITITQYGVILSNYINLNLDSKDISVDFNEATGVVKLTYSSTPPEVRNGGAIVLPAQYGFDVRVVDNYQVVNNTLILNTSQGSMVNLFKNTTFTLATSGQSVKSHNVETQRIIMPSAVGFFDEDGNYYENDLTAVKADMYQNGDVLWTFQKDFTGQTITADSSISWESCSFDGGLNGKFTFDFGQKKIDEVNSIGELNFFSFNLDGHLDADLVLKLNFGDKFESEHSKIIKKNAIKRITFKFIVGTVPVYIQVDTHIGADYQCAAEGKIATTYGVNYQSNVCMGAKWTDTEGFQLLNDKFNYDCKLVPHVPEMKVDAGCSIKASIYPHIDIFIYTFLGPWVEFKPYLGASVDASFESTVTSVDYVDWQARIIAGTDIRCGVNLSFGFIEFSSEPMNFEPFRNLIFQCPYRIRRLAPSDDYIVPLKGSLTVKYIVESYSTLTGKYYPCPNALLTIETSNAIFYKLTGTDGICEATFWPGAHLPDGPVVGISSGECMARTATVEDIFSFQYYTSVTK